MGDLKLYGIEESEANHYGSCRYRFHSLFNGTRGAWMYSEEKAREQGKKHQEIIRLYWQYSSDLKGIPNS